LILEPLTGERLHEEVTEAVLDLADRETVLWQYESAGP